MRFIAYMDYSRPFLAIEIEELKKAFSMQREEESDRYVTEITKDNVPFCKELLKMVDELRHIEGIRGNFYVNKTQYIAPATSTWYRGYVTPGNNPCFMIESLWHIPQA
jgi:beta-lactamase class D